MTDVPDRKDASRSQYKEGSGFDMKKFGFASIAATGFAAALIGLAGPAQADIGHHDWVQNNQQHAQSGVVTSTVGNGR
jgi:hypothetical protein